MGIMSSILFKCFKSEIMYYVVIPLSTVLLNWIKNRNDVKKRIRT